MGGRQPQVLAVAKMEVVKEGGPRPIRPITSFQLEIRAGDIVDVVVDPGTSMDCDGFAWRMFEIWSD